MQKIKTNFPMLPELEPIFERLDYKLYFVGGSVRNFMAGLPLTDLDMATPLTPDEVMDRLKNLPIKIVPTGIKHGTITLVLASKMAIELTTFRSDVQTDGRHATVQFQTDMTQDALRRDFTVNALYIDNLGYLYDPVHAMKDLKRRRIRFIGDAHQRITEDALRIIRYFRFYGVFERDKKPDKAAFNACRHNRALLCHVSIERIYDEMLKILRQENPYPALKLMHQAGILRQILGVKPNLKRLKDLLVAEKKTGVSPSDQLRLWALCDGVLPSFKMSNHVKNEWRTLTLALAQNRKSNNDLRAIGYLFGRKAMLQVVLLTRKRLSFPAYVFFERLDIPTPPFTPQDVQEYFNVSGAELGLLFRQCIEQWIDLGFIDKKDVVFFHIVR